MTIAKDFASKFAVAFVAVAMIFMAIAPAVQAAEAEDLQTTINDLLAQVAALKAEMEDDTTTSGSCVSVPAPLTMGAQNANVTALQNRLIADGNAIAAGATGYFGAQTKAALAAWQAANGVMPAVGYYGPITMAAMDADCTPADEDEDDGDDTSSDELQGEGTLDDSETDLDDASDDTIMEGEEDAELATLTLSADDGDIELSRVDFSLVDTTSGTANESDLWETFETISLWVDGDMIGEFEADDEDNYLNENNGTFRVSGLDLVIMEDEDVEIVVAATVMGAVDGSDTANRADWTLDATDVRYFDADGVASDDNITASVVTFEVVEEGLDDDATIESNSDTPESSTLKVDDQSDDSDEFDVHTFDIDVDEDSSDLVFSDMAFADVTVTGAGVGTSLGATFNDVVDSVFMTIGGETVEGDNTGVLTGSVAGIAAATVEYEFDFEDVELPAGEVTEATISIVFKGQDGVYDNGVTVETNVDGADWEVEGIAGDADVLTGTDTSEEFTLANVVPVISDVTADTTADDPNNSGTISFEFTVEADGDEDIVGFDIADFLTTLSSTASSPLTPTGVLSKVGGDATMTAPGVYTIADGDEATFAVDFTYTTVDAGDNGTYRVTLDSILGVEVDETSTGLGLSF